MATITKREWIAGAGPQVAWVVTYVDAAGKRRRKQFVTKGEAEGWELKTRTEVQRGIHTPERLSITVGEALDEWIAGREAAKVKRSTLKQYKEWSALHIKPLLGAVRLTALTTPDVERFKTELLKTRTKAMTAKAMSGLSMCISDAMRTGRVAQNVVKAASPVKRRMSEKRRKGTPPDRLALRAMLDAATDDFADFRPFLMTAIFTGLRASEMRALRWDDVDLKAATIAVHQRADQWGEIGPPKSDAGYRTLPLPASLVAELREWRLRCPKGKLGLVFPNTVGGVQAHNNLLRRRYWPLQVKAGECDPVLVDGEAKLDPAGRPVMRARHGLHHLRHAAASAWIKQRVDWKRLTVWMGHESVQTTIDIYGHLVADELGDAAIAAGAEAALFD
jgi:integrase